MTDASLLGRLRWRGVVDVTIYEVRAAGWLWLCICGCAYIEVSVMVRAVNYVRDLRFEMHWTLTTSIIHNLQQ